MNIQYYHTVQFTGQAIQYKANEVTDDINVQNRPLITQNITIDSEAEISQI